MIVAVVVGVAMQINSSADDTEGTLAKKTYREGKANGEDMSGIVKE